MQFNLTEFTMVTMEHNPNPQFTKAHLTTLKTQ
jgi:hypothetical protein